MQKTHVLAFALILQGCATASTAFAPAVPEWTRQSTRTVDNGYIVYLSVGESATIERAQLMAEGQALEDLANECSMIPKGTRIEDRFTETSTHNEKAYVKLAVDFQECDHAMRAIDPSEIKQIANLNFTQQLKRFQDFSETGELEAKSEALEIPPPEQLAPAPEREPRWSDQVHFYAARQYVAYQKQIVILSPSSAYQPGSKESRLFTVVMVPTLGQIMRVQEKQPGYRTQAWSHLSDRPHIDRPHSLAHPIKPSKPTKPHARRRGRHGR